MKRLPRCGPENQTALFRTGVKKKRERNLIPDWAKRYHYHLTVSTWWTRNVLLTLYKQSGAG